MRFTEEKGFESARREGISVLFGHAECVMLPHSHMDMSNGQLEF